MMRTALVLALFFFAAPSRAQSFVSVGNGVSVMETDAQGSNAIVVFAGWGVREASSQAWASALYSAWGRAHGARFVYAVKGPAGMGYEGREIATTALAAALAQRATEQTRFIAVLAHSSGTLVANELFYRLFHERADHGALTRGRVVYFNLDGGLGTPSDPRRRFSREASEAMRHVYFVGAVDRARRRRGFNSTVMQRGSELYRGRSTLLTYDASEAECRGPHCVHLTLINTRASSDGNESYSQFDGRPVNTWYLAQAAVHL